MFMAINVIIYAVAIDGAAVDAPTFVTVCSDSFIIRMLSRVLRRSLHRRAVSSGQGVDEVTSIALHSGAEGAVSLAGRRTGQMTRVMNNNRNLGAAIDLVGCYLKNYEIDKVNGMGFTKQDMVIKAAPMEDEA